MNITTREVNDVVIFDIEGEFRRPENQGVLLRDLVKAQLENRRKKLIVNLKNAIFVDDYGMGEILECHISVRNAGGKLKVALDLREYYNRFPVPSAHPPPEFLYGSVEDALDSFQPRQTAGKNWWQFWK